MAVGHKRLTELAHGGGCGCKLAPSVLRDLLADQAPIGAVGPGSAGLAVMAPNHSRP